jgi:putative membrane-bound dehydrogenase-like protein
MRRYVFVLIVLLAFALPSSAQDFKMEPGPKSPEDSLKCIKVRPGFKVELMVAEPLVQSPIAFAWGPDGKFWVVEMGDYPLGLDGKGKPGGRIKYLEKSKPDGPYDKMTLFMENLGFPTGVFPYGKGVLVTCAPDIFYAEATKGKGKADKKEILFTGFKEGNQQHRVNGLTWGIDNWIYGANGDSGGVIKSVKTGKSVDIRGRDFRFKVQTGEFEAQSGQSQYGRCRDDWGNWFGNNNSNPMYHYVLDDHYLKRNPHVLYPDPKVQVSVKPGAAEVFPISKPLPRFNSPQALNHFTSACSTIVYRDTLFGKDFEGNMFVSEPVHNLVHREIMKPKGVTFTSQRAADEQTSEFLASSDNWFRPTMIQVGPDGALWIADMYRYVIEHPEWIPKDWQNKLDLRAGHDKGRIYRVYPEGKKPREIVPMDKMKVEGLVKQLESPNGWVRDTAQQLLISKTASTVGEAKKTCKLLDAMMKETKVPQARLHALYYHAAVSFVGWEMPGSLEKYLKDPHPAIRKHSTVWLEGLNFLHADPKILDALEKDPNDQVRQQLAFSLGYAVGIDADLQRLVRLMNANAGNPYILAAGLSSISERNWKGIFAQLMPQERIPTPLFLPALRMAKTFGQPLDSTRLFARQLKLQEKLPVGQLLASVGEMLDAMAKNEISLKKLLEDAGDNDTEKTFQRLKEINGQAVKVVQDPKSALSEKMIALRLLGQGLGNDREDHKILVAMLTPQTPDDVQAAVIVQLSRQFDPRVPGLLLMPWKSYSPALRGQVLDTLFSRAMWTKMTVEAIKQRQIPASEIDAIRRQRLLGHKDRDIREASAKIFASSSSPDRGKLVDTYWLQMPDKADAMRGAKLFAKACATCHKLGGVGQNVGPDLASVGDKSVQGLLTAILDPNRAVEPRYVNYMANTKGGKTYNGIIASETSTSITLVGADGKEQQLLRSEIDELSSSGKSLMPDGLEKDLSPHDIADIIAYVRSNQTAPKRRELPGNQPKTLRSDKDGIFRLLPETAAVYGKSIVIEKKYGNFGYWLSPEDHVIWTVEVPKAGRYAVWIYYACVNDSAGNTLVFRSGAERLAHKVVSTGSWDEYRGRNIGELQLTAGTQQIIVCSEGKIRGALADLKKVELSPR